MVCIKSITLTLFLTSSSILYPMQNEALLALLRALPAVGATAVLVAGSYITHKLLSHQPNEQEDQKITMQVTKNYKAELDTNDFLKAERVFVGKEPCFGKQYSIYKDDTEIVVKQLHVAHQGRGTNTCAYHAIKNGILTFLSLQNTLTEKIADISLEEALRSEEIIQNLFGPDKDDNWRAFILKNHKGNAHGENLDNVEVEELWDYINQEHKELVQDYQLPCAIISSLDELHALESNDFEFLPSIQKLQELKKLIISNGLIDKSSVSSVNNKQTDAEIRPYLFIIGTGNVTTGADAHWWTVLLHIIGANKREYYLMDSKNQTHCLDTCFGFIRLKDAVIKKLLEIVENIELAQMQLHPADLQWFEEKIEQQAQANDKCIMDLINCYYELGGTKDFYSIVRLLYS